MLHAGGRRLEDLREWGAEQEVLGELGLEAVPDAVDAIISVAHHDPSTHVRGQALFWLAQKPGKRAAATITEAIENDPETNVKKHAVFALSQLTKVEGVPLLIRVARKKRQRRRAQAGYVLARPVARSSRPGVLRADLHGVTGNSG